MNPLPPYFPIEEHRSWWRTHNLEIGVIAFAVAILAGGGFLAWWSLGGRP